MSVCRLVGPLPTLGLLNIQIINACGLKVYNDDFSFIVPSQCKHLTVFSRNSSGTLRFFLHFGHSTVNRIVFPFTAIDIVFVVIVMCDCLAEAIAAGLWLPLDRGNPNVHSWSVHLPYTNFGKFESLSPTNGLRSGRVETPSRPLGEITIIC